MAGVQLRTSSPSATGSYITCRVNRMYIIVSASGGLFSFSTATVYRATDIKTGNSVAVKVVPKAKQRYVEAFFEW